MDVAFDYVVKNGLTTEDQYPNTADNGSCTPKTAAVKTDGYVAVPENNEKQLQHAVALQPVLVGVDGTSIMLYKEGIYDNTTTSVVNHALLIVGYGTENGVDYWVAKNSWGSTSWGEQGYIRLKRNVDKPEGTIMLATEPLYPTMNSRHNPDPSPVSPSVPPPAPVKPSPISSEVPPPGLSGSSKKPWTFSP
ncbi:hypothetical protein MPTK1_4g13900 [Marchantia polymorpha subsp. ruderalis]|uniref:Peptidase C1A papain C-terminal domain-containing protein n=2 Tax=Marchantia polymorpha TaxID=3197 RepID=A0A176VFT6_MARPO|nr:hypothetical protein AXG93_1860s1220 [Marchantia polymorpha subsp. ruderalis]PTQ35631.1 hypothetical protein MARPO_0070s0091 [Marchantia polymorpha]BBN08723.1 hypothetical protein Mp_4g13900 [Marchantia polymorpha subsp. ruderalis]|eukprot:PTQ35631.1 hypothetical protein MARPO_0070s0091 [Marchantia polymorpha]